MREPTPLEKVMTAALELAVEEQEVLIEVLHRKVLEERQESLVGEIRQAQKELGAGQVRAVSAEELEREIGS